IRPAAVQTATKLPSGLNAGGENRLSLTDRGADHSSSHVPVRTQVIRSAVRTRNRSPDGANAAATPAGKRAPHDPSSGRHTTPWSGDVPICAPHAPVGLTAIHNNCDPTGKAHGFGRVSDG